MFLLLSASTSGQAQPMLDGLNDIPVPADISWFPQTLGWKLLLFMAIAAIVYRCYLRLRRYVQNAYRRAALAILQQLGNNPEQLALLPLLLRKTALYGFPRTDVTAHVGKDWAQWLDNQCQGSHFAQHHAAQLAQLSYAESKTMADNEFRALKAHIAHWIKHHRGQYD
ncbi:DUF4381 domain-containing protein [Thalassotalea sp. Y01]|uniref:DUF4381 domain-containing protein n=1 Tax=Thalassotalea sp. Y01 TaxID=2729613 RepID=UPI00145E40B8|nr:DUF4381 domain-containing protein [Thalassotalea sp. Y01]NMP17449.1 DUF4381 domain-containing protein [Thalassotalea sp. Y01]